MIFISCILHCCTQVMTPDLTWLEKDNHVLQVTRQHCADQGKCLVKLKKVEEAVYTAVCGKANN